MTEKREKLPNRETYAINERTKERRSVRIKASKRRRHE
jgi:hypothetical protein